MVGHGEALGVGEELPVIDDGDREADVGADRGEREADVAATNDEQGGGRLDYLEHDLVGAGFGSFEAVDAGAVEAVVEGLDAGAREVVQGVEAIRQHGRFEGTASEAAKVGAIGAEEEFRAGNLTP
jgi:hypothetical protein